MKQYVLAYMFQSQLRGALTNTTKPPQHAHETSLEKSWRKNTAVWLCSDQRGSSLDIDLAATQRPGNLVK